MSRWDSPHFGPIIFKSEFTKLEPGKAIRGGIPLCFPWFGAGRTGDMKPSHGFARTAVWRLVANEQGPEGAWLVNFELAPSDLTEAELAAFPQDFVAGFSAHFSEHALTVSLTVTNLGDQEFSYEEALHTYFSVGDIHAVEISGLEHSHYFDKANPQAKGLAEPTLEPIEFVGETDRVYASTGTVQIDDPANGRVIVVEKQNSANTVVWNPWSSLAAGMSDLGDDEWRLFVCVESANVGGDAVKLAPGKSHTLTATYSVGAE